MKERETIKMKMALKLSETGRYFYVNPYGAKHACNVKKKNGETIIIFGSDEEIPKRYLKGNFYYRY